MVSADGCTLSPSYNMVSRTPTLDTANCTFPSDEIYVIVDPTLFVSDISPPLPSDTDAAETKVVSHIYQDVTHMYTATLQDITSCTVIVHMPS